MPTMFEPLTQSPTFAVANNSTFVLAPDEQLVSQTVEYTEGSSSSPYFIPSSLCD